MTNDELRALVRHLVQDRLRERATPTNVGRMPAEDLASNDTTITLDASHALYVSIVNVGDSCLIEPAVSCNHCGYCKSHGH